MSKQSSKKRAELAFKEHQRYLKRDIKESQEQLVKITTQQTLKSYLANAGKGANMPYGMRCRGSRRCFFDD